VARIEEFRAGYIFARDNKAYGRWRTRQRHPTAKWGADGGGLTGAALERRVLGLKMTNPGLVAMPGEKVRRMRKGDVLPRLRVPGERIRKPRKVRA
jgi:hypothetical protein